MSLVYPAVSKRVKWKPGNGIFIPAFASLAFISRTLPSILSHDFGKGGALSDHSCGVRGAPKGSPDHEHLTPLTHSWHQKGQGPGTIPVDALGGFSPSQACCSDVALIQGTHGIDAELLRYIEFNFSQKTQVFLVPFPSAQAF